MKMVEICYFLQDEIFLNVVPENVILPQVGARTERFFYYDNTVDVLSIDGEFWFILPLFADEKGNNGVSNKFCIFLI